MSENLRVLCNCKSPFQDRVYGAKVRVATPVDKSRRDGLLTQAMCTVCGAIHNFRGVERVRKANLGNIAKKK
jgi:hypothetical protein